MRVCEPQATELLFWGFDAVGAGRAGQRFGLSWIIVGDYRWGLEGMAGV